MATSTSPNSLLESIDSADKLANFLETKGAAHVRFFHYTTLESLKCILKNKTFRLSFTKSDAMNDRREPRMTGTDAEWQRLYTASFCYGTMERVALWGLYGVPKELAVRIFIPKAAMTLWMKYLNETPDIVAQILGKQENTKTKPADILKTPPRFFLTDIAYANICATKGELSDRTARYRNVFRWNDATSRHNLLEETRLSNVAKKLGDFLSHQELTGRVKHLCWEYEQEVRLCCRLNDKPMRKGAEMPRFIDVPIPDEVIKSMKFVLGPNVDEKLILPIRESIERILNQSSKTAASETEQSRFKSSDYAGLLNYRPNDLSHILEDEEVAKRNQQRQQGIIDKIKQITKELNGK